MISLVGQIRSEGKEELTSVNERELRHNVENYITYLPSQLHAAFTLQHHSTSRGLVGPVCGTVEGGPTNGGVGWPK